MDTDTHSMVPVEKLIDLKVFMQLYIAVHIKVGLKVLEVVSTIYDFNLIYK